MKSLALRQRSVSRSGWFATIASIVTAVNDGYSDRPSPFVHQLVLLPFCAAFLGCVYALLREKDFQGTQQHSAPRLSKLWILLIAVFESLSLLCMFYERRHFARFGYGSAPHAAFGLALVVLGVGLYATWRKTALSFLLLTIVAYSAGLLFAILAFPLNYLRSDMLPVIIWADQRLLMHLNPYGTIHVGSRLYDFPYLPGMLVAYLPAVSLHLDVRAVTLSCCIVIAGLLYMSARPALKKQAVVLIAIFLLCPFLQYRHDLYLEPHWLALTASIVLLRYRRMYWSASLFGVSMALYQLSWVLFPFLVLHAYRRDRLRGGLMVFGLGLLGMFSILTPFLRSATERIASNTVGQWSHMPHALADPINLSYWLTYIVRPDQLKWVQLAVMTTIFLYCVIRKRCQTVTDMLRCMSVALALFIMLNVLVDGYFYLTLLLLLLMYTFAATGLWPSSEEEPKEGLGGVNEGTVVLASI